MESILRQNRGNFATTLMFHKSIVGRRALLKCKNWRKMNGIELDIRSAGIFWSSGESDSAISS
jgi:hypothetical protein